MKWDHALINSSSVVSEREGKEKSSLKQKSLSLSHKVATRKTFEFAQMCVSKFFKKKKCCPIKI